MDRIHWWEGSGGCPLAPQATADPCGPRGAPHPHPAAPTLTLALGVGPARALAQLALRVLTHRAGQARVHVVGLVGVRAVGALLAHGVLLVLA